MAKILSRFLYTTFLIVTVTISMEAILRLWDPIGIEYVFEASRYFKIMERNPDYGYRHKAHHLGEYQGVTVSINSHGFRGPDFSVPKNHQKPRVMVLGDSVVFGWGAAEESITPVLLQKKLSPEFEVIGVGAGSWNTRMQSEFLKFVGKDYQVDNAILIVVDNDIKPRLTARTFVAKEKLQLPVKKLNPMNNYLKNRWKWVCKHSYLAATIQRLFTINDIQAEQEQMYYKGSTFRKDVEHAIKEIVIFFKEREIPLSVFLYGPQNSSLHKAYHSFYRTEFERYNVSVFVFPESLYELRNRNSFVDPHPNANGHAIMADVIMEKVGKGL